MRPFSAKPGVIFNFESPIYINLYEFTIIYIKGGPSKLQHQETPRKPLGNPIGFFGGFLRKVDLKGWYLRSTLENP